MRNEQAAQWLGNRALAANCATHARLFFGSADLGLTTAAHGRFTLTPTPAMRDALRADYVAMAGMIFGDVPPLDADACKHRSARTPGEWVSLPPLVTT
jgi:hypothetical protein